MAPPRDTDMDTSFLVGCIHKSKPVRDVQENLGLFSTINNARKDPDFLVEGANDLFKDIKRIAKEFSSSYTNGKEQLQLDLAKDTTFADQVVELGQKYGSMIWGRSGDSQESVSKGIPLHWSQESDQKRILFYIRCWIVRVAVKEFGATPRKPRGKNSAQAVESLEYYQTMSDSSSLSDRPLIPPARMLPPSTHGTARPTAEPWKESAAIRFRSFLNPNQDTSMNITRDTSAKRPIQTTPKKRKVIDIDETASNGKLPKIYTTVRSDDRPTTRWERDVYSIPRSPTTVGTHVFDKIAQPRIRESSCETDRTWRPRDESQETETIANAGEVQGPEIDSMIQSILLNSERDQPMGRQEQEQIIAGPSGTYQNPLRQDSVIPSDTQPSTQRAVSEPIECRLDQPNATTRGVTNNVHIVSRSMDWASLEGTRERGDRVELFKLLLSHLNGINKFNPDTYSKEAEDRMNMLLHQFRINDTKILQARLGDDFTRIYVVLESWMGMRHRLTGFRDATGYRGQPGEEWEAYLKRMPDVPCAHASLSYVELQESAMKSGELIYVMDTFDDDLATIFDLLTMVKGCNGPEAFKGIRKYNAALLEWFKQEG